MTGDTGEIMNYRILILAPFANETKTSLEEFATVVQEDWRDTGVMWDPVELGERIDRELFDAIVVERDFLFEETFDAAPKLRVAAICRGAVNQIDVGAATDRGILVLNTPGRNANAVAELVIAHMLDLARRVIESDRYIRNSSWESPTGPYTDLRGFELRGKTVGVVGFGAIGRRVGEICNALGMDVLVADPLVPATDITDRGMISTTLEDMIARADIVTLHCPSPANGEMLLDARAISSMKTGAFLLNTASSDLVDSAALVGALESGHLAGAGIDVFETTPIEPNHPLLSVPNTVLTPHIGGATDETILRHSEMIVEDLRRHASGKCPINLVNPSSWERRRGR